MRIAFIVIGNSRRSNYLNGHNLRYGNGGGSGTDTSSILIAEHLAKNGHEVVIATEDLENHLQINNNNKGIFYKPGEKFYNVCYTNTRFDNIENKEFDILISMLWFHEYDTLPIRITKSLIYWSHMQWLYGINEILNYVKKHNLSLGFVHISEWEKKMTGNITKQIKLNEKEINVFIETIPNPIMDEIINEVLLKTTIKKQHKFIFHAAWARGGNVAIEAVRQLPYDDKEFHAFDYLMATHAHTDSFFHMHNGVDKKTLFSHLAESEYFIYPLYTPYEDVHKDTFSCVIAEAISLGVIPITYPLGALPEIYDGYCVWLDLPANANLEQMQNEPLSKDYNGIFKCTDNIIQKIYYLENNPQIKEQLRVKGGKYIMDNFNSERIGNMWLEMIKNSF